MKNDSIPTLPAAGAGVSNIFCSRNCEESAQVCGLTLYNLLISNKYYGYVQEAVEVLSG